MGGLSDAQAAVEESKTKAAKEEESNIYEEWRNKRIWSGHKGGKND
jgi:hypothetical protein